MCVLPSTGCGKSRKPSVKLLDFPAEIQIINLTNLEEVQHPPYCDVTSLNFIIEVK
jgi:hypothetical protein